MIGIILVVFGHSFHEYPDGSMGKTLLVYRMMYSFRMPLFMFVSGFLMVYTCFMNSRTTKWTLFAASKVKRLMIPYLFLTLITFIPRTSLSFMADDNIVFSAESLFRAIFYGGDSMIIPIFWFLQASFMLLLSVHLLISSGKKAGIPDQAIFIGLILCSVILLIMPFNTGSFFSINEAVRLSIYFVSGAAYCRYHDSIDRIIDWNSVYFLIISATFWIMSFFLTEGTQWITVCSIFGIAMCISLAKIMEQRKITVFDPLIGSNYMIFFCRGILMYCRSSLFPGYALSFYKATQRQPVGQSSIISIRAEYQAPSSSEG